MTKYQEIYNILRSKIVNKKIKANTYLPSEMELRKEFNASRDTIRKALNLLASNGYIHKEKGKGSLVLDLTTINFPVSGITSYKELVDLHLVNKSKTFVHEFNLIPANEEIQSLLNVTGGNVYKTVRVRTIDGERIIIDTDYLRSDIIKGLEIKHAQNSLYEYIEDELGLTISFARKEITVIPATDEEKELLDMKDYGLLVCVRSWTYLEDATLFQYTVSKHRPDKFRFVDFARCDKAQKM